MFLSVLCGKHTLDYYYYLICKLLVTCRYWQVVRSTDSQNEDITKIPRKRDSN